MDAENPGFTQAERRDPLFRKFMNVFKARLEHHRERNDQDLDDVKTAKIRGQIAEAQFFLGLEETPTPTGDGRRRR